MQRLLTEGTKLPCQTPEGAAHEARVYDPFLGMAYSHLAAALGPHVVQATGRQLATVASLRGLPATKVAIDAGTRPAFSDARVGVKCLVMTRRIIALQRLRSWRAARQPPPLLQRLC